MYQNSPIYNSANPQSTTQTQDINLTHIVEDLFLVLTNKEKDVIIKRFSLNNQPKQTLEKIGKQFNVTRERVRQIEKIALNKLRRTIDNTQLKNINILARETLKNHGGLIIENELVSLITKQINQSSIVDKNIILLALHIDPEIEKNSKSNDLYDFWFMEKERKNQLKNVLSQAHKLLEQNKDVINEEKIIKDIELALKEKGYIYDMEYIRYALKADKNLKYTKAGIGLSRWRHINPKSIRDKAHIILKEAQRPLHFIEIADKISSVGFDKKQVTNQAVHNELIRCKNFVLVGRGLYALKEWGYKEGTVADVIEMLLKKKSPLTKKQIMKGVLKQRKVKKGTISLNLQKNPKFVRVGRAVYTLKEEA